MTAEQNVYKEEIGKELIINLGADITGASGYYIEVLKPSGVQTTWTAQLNGTKEVKYITQPGDLDEEGTYKLQVKIVFSPGVSEILSETLELYVKALFT